MIATLAAISLRGLLNRRRTLLLGCFAALLVLMAVLFRLADQPADEARAFTAQLLGTFGLAVLLPVVAVVVGTAAIGSELDDGTIVYLLAKPVPRALVATVKGVVAWVVVVVIVCPAIVLAGVIPTGDAALGAAYAVAAAFAALEYTAVFVALSLVTTRALVVGLAYVVVWEGVVAGLFDGTRILSVRQHALAVADALAGEGALEAGIELGPALVVGAVVTVVAAVYAIRRLERVELRGETA